MKKLKDGMLLYHGSYTIVKEISLEKCGNAKDFGKGFYLLILPIPQKAFTYEKIKGFGQKIVMQP